MSNRKGGIGMTTSSIPALRTSEPVSAMRRAEDFVSASDAELAAIDPLELNLIVAKGAERDLDMPSYKAMADEWAEAILAQIPAAEEHFHSFPRRWLNDVRYARLAVMACYVNDVLRMRYHEGHDEDQKHNRPPRYTRPGDLFLHGLMDTRLGTCANMPMLHVALGWRLGWPVSLACVGSHNVVRYDDGDVIYNIEATNSGEGRLGSPPDAHYIDRWELPRKALGCGSDLGSITPRQMLGTFFGLRARHLECIDSFAQAELDWLLARYLFPNNRALHFLQLRSAVRSATELFEPYEAGHPIELASFLQQVVRRLPYADCLKFKENWHAGRQHDCVPSLEPYRR
jgi:hypothetical protein